jgi:hypothetical protein
MYRSFNDFSNFTAALPTDNIIMFRPTVGEYKIDLFTISKVLSGGLLATPNVLYVTASGSDSFPGTNEQFPKRTIKAACKVAADNPSTKYTIFVRTGDYYEENPVYVASNTSLIGDNLRRTNIYPKNPTYDILWVSNSVYIWGFTFRGHKGYHTYGSPPVTLTPAAIAFYDLDIANNNLQYTKAFYTDPNGNNLSPAAYVTIPTSKPYIVTSPYPQGCSSITSSTTPGANNAGCGVRIDGSKARGFLRSMVLDSYTQFNEGGMGVHIINNGYAQLVSTFTICCTEGVKCESGGTCSINTSNCSFGLSGLVAIGKSPFPVLSGTLFTACSANDAYFTITGATSSDTNVPVKEPYVGMVMNLSGDSTNTLYTFSSAAYISPGKYRIFVDEVISTNLPATRAVYFYIRSQITTSTHTMEYVGSGTVLSQAVPALGGLSKTENQACQADGGRVYFTVTDEKGDFRIGNNLTIVQSTGTIEGDAFEKSLFSLVTPFVLTIEG